MHLVVFEDPNWHWLAPLSFCRPLFALASGAGTLLDRQIRQLQPTRLTLWVRPQLAARCAQELADRLPIPVWINQPLDDEPALLLSARVMHAGRRWAPEQTQAIVTDAAEPSAVLKGLVRMKGLDASDAVHSSARWRSLLDLPRATENVRAARYAWDLISWNAQALVQDFEPLRGSGTSPARAGPWHILAPEQVMVHPEANLEPGAVLDASRGPIVIDREAVIGANSVLRGPCCIGAQTHVKALSLIDSGTSIGPVCKVGGEISNSIIIGYSNKWHDGYLGDSYLGQWVNLGAGTTTSNLRNTYSSVKMKMGWGEIDTGRKNVGSLIGDHAKTAIGTRLMTGSYIGYSSMIASSQHPPTFVPSFTFMTDKGTEAYRADKAVDVMKAMHARKGIAWPAWGEENAAYASQAANESEAKSKARSE